MHCRHTTEYDTHQSLHTAQGVLNTYYQTTICPISISALESTPYTAGPFFAAALLPEHMQQILVIITTFNNTRAAMNRSCPVNWILHTPSSVVSHISESILE